jgi:hypothetical protein
VITAGEWEIPVAVLKKSSLGSSEDRRKSDLIAEALELSEAAALEAFGAKAIEIVGSKFAVSGRLRQSPGRDSRRPGTGGCTRWWPCGLSSD